MLFGLNSALPSGASIILSSTVSPGFVTQLEQRLQSMSLVMQWINLRDECPSNNKNKSHCQNDGTLIREVLQILIAKQGFLWLKWNTKSFITDGFIRQHSSSKFCAT